MDELIEEIVPWPREDQSNYAFIILLYENFMK